jgi:hypothetical protein
MNSSRDRRCFADVVSTWSGVLPRKNGTQAAVRPKLPLVSVDSALTVFTISAHCALAALALFGIWAVSP